METSAIARTWVVRFAASWLTFSVSAFHVPATPGTAAWPPRRPSVPTSRATRVTSSAKARSCSTIVLTVSLSSATSPCASTVIIRDRSPWATAVVTSAMPRTCVVRLAAMTLTLSVRSFQVPATPGTCAWPPRRPSVPTSRATRVTSSAKEPRRATISLTTRPIRANSPRSGCPSMVVAMVCDRSPSATAPMTRATSLVGRTRSSTRRLIAVSISPQAPGSSRPRRRWSSRPSAPMTCPSEAISSVLARRREARWS